MPTLAFLGDVMLGRGVNRLIGEKAPDSFWGDVLPALRSVDAVIANLECAVTDRTEPWTRSFKVFHFGARPQAVAVLRAANIRCVTLANNHTLDFREPGLLDTLDHLNAACILRAGAGRNAHDAAAPALLDLGSVTIGVVAFTDNEPPFAAGPDRPGTNYLEISTEPAALGRLERAVKDSRDAGADLVVLSLHWGPNMVTRPPQNFRDFAHAAVDRGVDLIFGHSAHLFQGVEVYRQRVILYDIGDFLDDYAVDPDLRNDWSLVFLADVDNARITKLRMLPVRLTYAEVNLATGEEFNIIRRRMISLCHDLGTHPTKTDDGLELRLT